ncbi:MAG: 1-deoxy-D-xylulose-5-phosphate reductoisomerase [Phycisphaerales bacterium]|jgi:1-deoxy-D-xylulose-5-phosphate reductoisomerase|nr:1-deoxy-D-xylulose-5-phosphate reductoisomerase [Phycisphaerales bacterium]
MHAGTNGSNSVLRVVVLGSTGSVGTQTLEVIDHLNALHARGVGTRRYEVVGLAAGRNVVMLRAQARAHPGATLALAEGEPPESARRVLSGPDAARQLVREVECDLVVGAMVGASGLPAMIEAISRGVDVALANKETLVAAGAIVIPLARDRGARILPLDSEHSALWQLLQCAGAGCVPPMGLPAGVARVLLTASGGPFRTWDRERIARATPAEALAHPVWDMGAKVTIDSASLMNKALEVVEAHWLFGAESRRIGVGVHPRSIVHAMLEFEDGVTLAQMGAPDMRVPIQYALAFPERLPALGDRVEGADPGAIEIRPPDLERFPALALGFRAIDEGGTSGAVLSAANEEAVAAFLHADGGIPFGRIFEVVSRTIDELPVRPIASIEDVIEADRAARAHARSLLGRS